MDHITKPVAGMDAAVKPDTPVSVPAQGNGLSTNLETGSARPLPPAAVPHGGKDGVAFPAGRARQACTRREPKNGSDVRLFSSRNWRR